MKQEAQWEIRVGGEYEFSSERPHLVARVTAIDGEKVFWIHKYVNADGVMKRGEEFGANCDSSWLFRSMHLPEDNSPIPVLVEALKGIHAGVLSNCEEDDTRLNLNVSREAWDSLCVALGVAA